MNGDATKIGDFTEGLLHTYGYIPRSIYCNKFRVTSRIRAGSYPNVMRPTNEKRHFSHNTNYRPKARGEEWWSCKRQVISRKEESHQESGFRTGCWSLLKLLSTSSQILILFCTTMTTVVGQQRERQGLLACLHFLRLWIVHLLLEHATSVIVVVKKNNGGQGFCKTAVATFLPVCCRLSSAWSNGTRNPR